MEQVTAIGDIVEPPQLNDPKLNNQSNFINTEVQGGTQSNLGVDSVLVIYFPYRLWLTDCR